MGIPVLIMGESGSGKSASMRNFEADDLLIFNKKGYIQRYCQRIK